MKADYKHAKINFEGGLLEIPLFADIVLAVVDQGQKLKQAHI